MCRTGCRTILDLSDSVSVLRDGAMIGTHEMPSLTESDLIRMMVGREVGAVRRAEPVTSGATPLLSVDLPGARFVVMAGEVVGLAGLIGSGRTELLETIFGVRTPAPAMSGCVEQKSRLGVPRIPLPQA